MEAAWMMVVEFSLAALAEFNMKSCKRALEQWAAVAATKQTL